MKIGQKLTLSYVVIAIVATITAVVASASYRNITSAFEQLQNGPIRTTRALVDLRKYAVAIITCTSEIGYIYSESASGTQFEDRDISNEQKELDQAYLDFDNALARYENLAALSNRHDFLHFNNIEFHGARIKEISGEFVLLKKNGGKGKPVLDMREAFEEHQTAFIEATDAALEAEYAEMNNHQQNVIATISASRLTSELLTFFVFAFAISSGLLISRSISKRLSALKGATEEIGNNRLEARVDIRSRDELGDLGRSFNNMACDLQKASTERKAAEEQLKLFNMKLQQSNRELQDFAYVASHDLQEPLRKVQTFADRLGSRYAERLDEAGLDYLDRMRNAAIRMQTLIQDLLAFSRVTTKAQPFAPVDLDQITQEVLSDLEVKIEDSGALIETCGLPEIEADPLQMRQLVQNLVGNALKFRRTDINPVIKISSTNGRSDDRGPVFTITVEDNGIGFDEKYLDKIFTVFQRLHGRTEYEGSGIGLAVCRKIVERHLGTISAKSTPGQGAKFIVTLPRYQPKMASSEERV